MGAIHLVRTYLMTNFSTFLPLSAPLHILDDPLHSPSCVCTQWMAYFSTKKTNNYIRVSHSLKYKHSKKNKFFKSYTRPRIFHLISVTLSHINGIIIEHFKSHLSECFWVSQLQKYDGNIVVKYVFSKSVEKIFQNLRVRLKFSIR